MDCSDCINFNGTCTIEEHCFEGSKWEPLKKPPTSGKSGSVPGYIASCPFCGCAANEPTNESSGRPVWEITCSQFCVTMKRGSRKEVIKCWNERAT